MTNPKLKDFPTEKLVKKRRQAFGILIIVGIAITLSLGIILYDLITEGSTEAKLLIPTLACMVPGIAIFKGLKDIDEELKQRKP